MTVRTLLLGALLLALSACASPDSYRMNSGDMGATNSAALAAWLKEHP